MQDAQPLSIIIAEHGTDPRRIRDHAETAAETLVLEQFPGESFGCFAARVRAEAAALADCGHPVTRVSLLAPGRAESDTVSERSLLVRGLASAMSRGPGGVIKLESAGGADRFQLASLALTLDGMLRGTGVAVRHVDTGRRRQAAVSEDRLTAIGGAAPQPEGVEAA